jgi:hypothetical protein
MRACSSFCVLRGSTDLALGLLWVWVPLCGCERVGLGLGPRYGPCGGELLLAAFAFLQCAGLPPSGFRRLFFG